MTKLTLGDISDLRAYERERNAFRGEVIALKQLRRLSLGPVVTVVFENRMTMRFQIQEMARAERIMSDDALEEQLAVYNALIPEPGELSLTVFLELTTEDELREWLPKLVGIERSFVLRIGEGPQSTLTVCVVDEEHATLLTRETTTASVHYVRFVLSENDQRRFGEESVVLMVDHPEYRYEHELTDKTKGALLRDWMPA